MKSPSIRPIHDEIAVVGWACRLPGANSIDELWTLLMEERCAITSVPEDRFPLERFGHPRRQERGKSYTWAAGVLDDIWSFDPSVFGISPREAVQIDPQQRILLQLTWEALEDAGIPPSSVAGSEVGVFVGASQADYGHSFFGDPAIADSHFATGTALAILANRISYIFGLHGPSFTVDTACSSSLVALHQAMQALRSGRIDTAIVAGCNLVASPASFIAFSQANMLSPTGQCRAFAAAADGFVRAEGAVVLVLRKAAFAQQNPVHGTVIASDVNSDGRTNGIALPSLDAQQALLSRIYERGGIDANRLAFVEAHGTGTPVGDPIEATAIGRIIGQRRGTPLPIGSVKTNVGHLEPASGLVGVLKALLALNHGLLPPSLNFDEPNPNIPFDTLNLAVCTQPLLLPHAAEQYAGVNSFGFGGTNGHVVLGAGRKAAPPVESDFADGLDVFTISANSTPALQALAREYRGRVTHQSDRQTAIAASAIIHRREQQMHRLVISSTHTGEVARALDAYLAGSDDRKLTTGTAIGRDLPVAFVFSGNGGQKVGMGRAAYRNNAAFRNRFEEVDSYFREIGGWSLKDALFSETLHDRLQLTSVAQPLIFAIQTASTAALAAAGLKPAVVLGHSVGEVAAAEAAGALDLRTAVKVIHFRSHHQESCRGKGRMAAVLASSDAVQELIDAGAEGISIAAINGPRTLTIAGSGEALAAFKQMAKKRGIAQLDLGLDYPFHTAVMDSIRAPLETDLREIRCHDSSVPFVSTVTGACLAGSRLNGHYWWRNVREPVRFTTAIRAAAELGARYFVEVGPRGVLSQHVVDTLKGEVSGVATYVPLGRADQQREHTDDDTDPFASACAHAIVTGAQVSLGAVFGPNPGPAVPLPPYPWQNSAFRFKPTVEAVDGDAGRPPHPFAGTRSRSDALEWRGQVDSARLPALSDHKLGEQTIFPGTGFVEISLAVGRQWLESERVTLSRFEILNPLDLSGGETREILTRISPSSGTLEILSRPRLSDAGWLLHCRGKLLASSDAAAPDLAAEARTERTAARVIEPAELYAVAEASGLHYGPAFRLVQRVSVDRAGVIDVQLTPPTTDSQYVLDPMRLDAGAHGFFTLFEELHAVERGVTYIPVRLEEVVLFKPHVAPHRARIVITSKSERSIVGDCYLYGGNNELAAVLRGVRSQAIPTRRASGLDSVAFVELARLCDGTMLAETGVEADVGAIMAAAKASGFSSAGADAGQSASDAGMLLEGWAIAQAHEVASSLATDDVVDADALLATGRIPERAYPWLVSLLGGLGAAHLAKRDGGAWRLVRDPALPSAGAVVATIAREQPNRAGETLLAAAVAHAADTLAHSVSAGLTIATPEVAIPKAVLDFHFATSVPLQTLSDAAMHLLQQQKHLWRETRALRVLQVGFAPLAQKLLDAQAGIQLTVLEPDRRRYASAELALARQQRVSLVDAEQAEHLGEFDLIVSVAGVHRLPASLTLGDLQRKLAPNGLLVALEPRASLFKDLVFGLDPDWFRAGSADRPASALLSSERWRAALDDAGFAECAALNVVCGGEAASLLVAKADVSADASALPAGGRADASAVDSDIEMVMHIGDFADASSDLLDPAAALTRRCLEIRASAAGIGERPSQLWLVFSGALAVEGSRVKPVETGAWAFSRTLANEFPNLDVRRIDVAPSVVSRGAPAIEALVRRIAASGTAETEVHTDGHAVHAVRVTGLRSALRAMPASRRVGARLERRVGGGERLAWQPIERTVPRAGEVELEVEATGLNFRDVMWSMSLLPEDMLEHGFSGPTLGLECAGRVVRVGRDVTDLAVGDRVMVFAASSFANYVTVAADQAVRLPATLSCEAAATIPVAFFTAYYALITQAQLKRREWVLIHGGAGAVGLAAIQIAQARGAKVIATAGSPAKRELLTALGVAHVLDSRSTAFVDEIRRLTGEGVDVVLNSLAGEAMERSISCLRPFGRFVELGKRDYVSDTHVGLRPFRRNLSYFGVDVDQVIGARKALGKRVFARIIGEFAKGTYRPLPYSVFEADGVATAFHLMQQAGHIGKIVVRPPQGGVPARAGKPFQVSKTGTHVITGAFGGFGLETAKWLVAKGARHLVMIGRRGPASAEAQAVLKDFATRGIPVLAKACDVTDRRALEQLFEVVHATMPAVAGVVHAAMVLDDGILANLDAERFQRVLGPKLTGAENLDQLVRGESLDYFVLYSSVTTLIGNPGQANYVAANAYMEGLARRRRLAGQPALAVGWGPIADVGVLAQHSRLKAGLERLTGSAGLRSRDALDLMEQALSLPPELAETAVITISPSDSSYTADRLPVLRSPTYEAFVGDRRAGAGDGEVVDLRAIAAKNGVDAARRKATEVIGAQVAHVLQLSEADVSPVRPLGEIGLDSLMALELVLNLEERFGLKIPLTGASGGVTVADIADKIVAQIGLDRDQPESVVATLAGQHHGEVAREQMAALEEIAEVGVQTTPTPKVRILP